MMSTWESLIWSLRPPESRDFQEWAYNMILRIQKVIRHHTLFTKRLAGKFHCTWRVTWLIIVVSHIFGNWKGNWQPGSHRGSSISLVYYPTPQPTTCGSHVRPLRAVRVNIVQWTPEAIHITQLFNNTVWWFVYYLQGSRHARLKPPPRCVTSA